MKSKLLCLLGLPTAIAVLPGDVSIAGTESRTIATTQHLARGVSTYRVGSGCAHPTIQSAVDAIADGGSGVLRLRTATYSESVLIGNKTIEIIGGHDNCSSATPTAVSAINGGNSPAVSLIASTGAHTLTLTNTDAFNGTGGSLLPGGGVSLVSSGGAASLAMNNSWVYSNSGPYGAGVALVEQGAAGGTVTIFGGSLIQHNVATGSTPRGGGLYCEGSYSITMIGGRINGNVAGVSGSESGRGGGIHLNGCNMDWYAQSSSDGEGSLRDNISHGQGGGLYATSGAQVNLRGAHLSLGGALSTQPLVVRENAALGGGEAGRGGGIYATGSGTRVRLDRGYLVANSGSIRAGAFHAGGGAEIIIERSSETCHNPRVCSLISSNSGGFGAVGTSDESSIIIRRTLITNNITTGPESYFTDLFALGFNGEISISDSLIYGNTSDAGFTSMGFVSTPTLNIYRSTIAANDLDVLMWLTTNNMSLSILDSILYQPDAAISASERPAIVDCVLWSSEELQPGNARALIADPMFLDPDEGLFYLQTGSPAIDFCEDFGQPPDLEFNPRGILHGNQPERFGPVDLGAYEIAVRMFSDRFEAP